MRKIVFGLVFVTCSALVPPARPQSAPPDSKKRTQKPGVTAPGVQVPMDQMQRSAEFNVGGAPDWMAIAGDEVYVSNMPKNSIFRLGIRTKQVLGAVTGFDKPCSGLALGFDSLWVPNCGSKTLARVDLKSHRIAETLPTGVADSEGGIAVGAGSVWLMTDGTSVLARIDPRQKSIVSRTQLPRGCFVPAFGLGAVWVTCTDGNKLVRIDPAKNAITAVIDVGPKPRFLAVGEGAVWTLNQGDGSVTRVDPGTNRVSSRVEVGVPGPGGDISANEGAIWVTSFGYPLSRIDPKTNAVMQQFVGKGGDAVRAGDGFVFLTDLRRGLVWELDPKNLVSKKAPDHP